MPSSAEELKAATRTMSRWHWGVFPRLKAEIVAKSKRMDCTVFRFADGSRVRVAGNHVAILPRLTQAQMRKKGLNAKGQIVRPYIRRETNADTT